MKYAAEYKDGTTPGSPPDIYHQDFGNNTLGPRLRPQNDDFQHVACFYCLDDVSLGQAPIQMWPNHSKDKKDVEKMIVPGGSICFYSIYTYHASSEWNIKTNPYGHRPVMFVSYCNATPNRLWDGGRYFTIKSSQIYSGHYYHKGGVQKAFSYAMEEFNPLQLKCAFMLPLPGDELWTDDFLNAWCKRWTKFNRKPYDDARKIKNHDNNNQQAKL